MKIIRFLSILLILLISFTFFGEQPLSVNAQSEPFIKVTVNAGVFRDRIVLEGFPVTDEYAEVIVFRDGEGGDVVWSDEQVTLESGYANFKLPFWIRDQGLRKSISWWWGNIQGSLQLTPFRNWRSPQWMWILKPFLGKPKLKEPGQAGSRDICSNLQQGR